MRAGIEVRTAYFWFLKRSAKFRLNNDGKIFVINDDDNHWQEANENYCLFKYIEAALDNNG